MLLIGSTALLYHTPARRAIADIDLVGTYDEITAYGKLHKASCSYPINAGKSVFMKIGGSIVEAEVAWPDSRAERLIEFVIANDDVQHTPEGFIVPSLDMLYLLKISHRYLKDSPHFLKTMRDIQEMRKLGAKIRPEWEGFLKQREKETYVYALPKLNQSKQDFFDNSASIYTLEHDDIHEAVKHLDKPAYEYFKPDSAEVMTSKAMFFACSEEVRLYAALEEVMVLSIERSIHPFPNVNRKWAFDMAAMKLSTSISSGWFREYVWENYDKLQEMYSESYVDRFYDALNNGRIKPFGE